MKVRKVLIIVLILFNFEGTYCGKCGSDKLNIKPKQLDLKPEDKKTLQALLPIPLLKLDLTSLHL